MSKAKKRTLIIIAAAFAFIIANLVVIYAVTPSFMVQPNYNEAAAAVIDANALISKVSVSSDSKLSGYYFDREDTDKILVFFGGIGEDAATNMENILSINEQGFLCDYDIGIIDWPEYGRSEGKAGADTLRSCAKDSLDYFSSLPHSEIAVMAFSMGTGPAAYAVSELGCDKLVLLAPYASAVDLYNGVVPVFYGPIPLLLRFKMPTAQYAEKISCDTLIVASRSDKKVAYSSSEKLAAHFNGNVEFVTLDGFSHGEVPYSEETLTEIADFLS